MQPQAPLPALRLLFVAPASRPLLLRPCPGPSAFVCRPKVTPQRVTAPARRARVATPLEMRQRGSGSGRGRNKPSAREFSASVSMLVERATTWWARASTNERAAAGALALAAVSVSAVAVNVFVNVSLALAFFLVPLALAPFVLTILASVTAFAFLAFATAGAGFFFVSTPFFAVALLAKALLPVVVVAAAVAAVVRGVLKGKTDGAAVDQGVDGDEDDEDEGAGGGEWQTRDQLEEFDRMLRRRGASAGGRSWNVAGWSLSEVVDELDVTGLGEYRQLFIDERIDGRTLLALSDDDIRSEFSAMPLGDRMRLSRLVADLRRRSRT